MLKLLCGAVRQIEFPSKILRYLTRIKGERNISVSQPRLNSAQQIREDAIRSVRRFRFSVSAEAYSLTCFEESSLLPWSAYHFEWSKLGRAAKIPNKGVTGAFGLHCEFRDVVSHYVMTL